MQMEQTEIKRKKTRVLLLIMLVILLSLVFIKLLMHKMNRYIDENGKSSMGAVVEQIQQTYDLQVNRYYSQLHLVEDYLLQEKELSLETDTHKKIFEAWEKESESIQNQKSMLINYAIEKGYDIYHIYSDEDYSGIDRDRPDFNRMIEAASQQKFDIILAKTQSRFTRDMELVEKYLHGKFVEWGIRFIAVVDHVDTADETNKKSRQINGLVNEWYLEDLSNNVRSVLTHKRREGKYIGTFALYGYTKDPADNNHLLVDLEAAEVVRRIFTLYLSGNGTTRIARILNEEGIPSPRWGQPNP